jgi:hypothetical protein
MKPDTGSDLSAYSGYSIIFVAGCIQRITRKAIATLGFSICRSNSCLPRHVMQLGPWEEHRTERLLKKRISQGNKLYHRGMYPQYNLWSMSNSSVDW